MQLKLHLMLCISYKHYTFFFIPFQSICFVALEKYFIYHPLPPTNFFLFLSLQCLASFTAVLDDVWILEPSIPWFANPGLDYMP